MGQVLSLGPSTYPSIHAHKGACRFSSSHGSATGIPGHPYVFPPIYLARTYVYARSFSNESYEEEYC